MIRSILAVIAGSVVWTILWLGSHAVLSNVMPNQLKVSRVESVPALLLLIVLSVTFSIIAGYVTAQIARRKEMTHVWALGILQLAMGIAAQLSYFDVLPVWYHITFLLLLIPGNLIGGLLRTRKNETSFA